MKTYNKNGTDINIF